MIISVVSRKVFERVKPTAEGRSIEANIQFPFKIQKEMSNQVSLASECRSQLAHNLIRKAK